MAQSLQIEPVTDEFLEELPEHHEIVCGRLVRKALASNEHGLVQQRLGAHLMLFDGRKSTPGGWWTSLCPSIVLTPHVRHYDPHSHWYEPDVAAWKISVVPERPRGARSQVRPQWVCEILSPSNANTDKGLKLDAYHRAGVNHYWLVDPEDKTLTVLAWTQAGYQTILTAKQGELACPEPFVERELDLAWLFDFE